MAIELYKSQGISALHSNGESFARSLLNRNDVTLDTSSSAINGSASLIFASFVFQSLVGELPAEKNIQELVVAQLSTGKAPKSDDFSRALKELEKMQSWLATSKSKLTTLDPESKEAERLQQICSILQEKISLFNLLGTNSTALLAG